MYGWGRMGYWGRRRSMASHGGVFPPGLLFLVGGLFLLSAAGHALHFLPLVFLFWMVPFFLLPALGVALRGLSGLAVARRGGVADEGSKERELLEALARHGELSPARAALETSLTVAEADRMLSGLAKSGYVEVRAYKGGLGYALWERDRPGLVDGS